MSEFRRKKVVFLLPSLAAGGAERVLITLMNNIDRNQFAPELISFRRNGPLKHLIRDDVIVHDIGSYKKIFLGVIPLVLKLRKIKPNIVMTTMAHTNFLLLLIQPLIPKARIIVREAITPSFMFKTMKVGWLVKILYKVLYPRAHLVLSPSQRIIDEFNDLLDANTGHHKLLYNPVNVDRIRSSAPVLENKTKEREKTVHFICAGRMHPQKGFDQLINALPLFKCKYNWKLTILGGGRERRYLENLIEKHGLQNNVFLPGFTQTPWPHIGAADCFLMPSRFEGLPNVVLESLSLGTPVIATSTSGGIREIANFTHDKNVRIAHDMTEFLNLMSDVKPKHVKNLRDSLLPEKFSIETTLERFTKILNALDEFNPKRIRVLKRQHRGQRNKKINHSLKRYE